MINFKMRTSKTGAEEAMTHDSGIHFLVSLTLSCCNELHVGRNEIMRANTILYLTCHLYDQIS